MNDNRRLRFYGYVARPCEEVRGILHSRADELLQRATRTASDRAGGLIARLHVGTHGLDLGVDVKVQITGKPDDAPVAGLPEVTHIGLSWKAATGSGLFPSMTAELSISPMTFAETRVEFDGTYDPPLGAPGKVFDVVLGHRIAEAAVHRFVNEVIEQLRKEPSAGG